MHRRKDLYGEDAELFRPERWEENDGRLAKTIGYGYLPFNGGPRVCLGQEFALTEAGYTIVRLLQTFPSLTLPVSEQPAIPAGEERQAVTLVLASADGCCLELRLHDND
jgi:cytochrome P450